MTQLLAARDRRLTAEMERAARAEGVTPGDLAAAIAAGAVVLPFNNRLPDHYRAVAIGAGLRTKVNANIGTSRDHEDLAAELCKARVAAEAGADTLMDLSTGGDLPAIRAAIIQATDLPLGTVPVYEAAARAGDAGRTFDTLTVDELFAVVEAHARDGVSFMTIHAGITRQAITRLKEQGREMGIVSRGGALTAGWMARREAENPFFEFYDRLLELALA